MHSSRMRTARLRIVLGGGIVTRSGREEGGPGGGGGLGGEGEGGVVTRSRGGGGQGGVVTRSRGKEVL